VIMTPDVPSVECRTSVSRPDIEYLDDLLEYWRESENHRCSAGTSDCDVLVTWISDERAVDTEIFRHAFPPSDENERYWRFFLRTVMGTVRNQMRQVAQSKRESFRGWALRNRPVKEVRFLNESTIYALLDSSAPCDSRDVRWLAYDLSKSYAEYTEAEAVTCHLFRVNRSVAKYTFKW
jgi:hypothetical protein